MDFYDAEEKTANVITVGCAILIFFMGIVTLAIACNWLNNL
jgi:hypothetical protein